MKKIFNRYLVIVLIIAVVFNLLVFLIPVTPKDKLCFWLTYSFGMLSIVSQPAIAYYAFKNESLKSKIYGWPILKIGYIYLAVQLIATLISFILGLFIVIPYWILIIIYALILGFAIIGLLFLDAYRETIEKIEQKTIDKTIFINNLKINVSLLSEDLENEVLRKEIKALSEEIKYSDPVSNDSVSELENEIDTLYIQLKERVELNEDDEAIKLTKKLLKLVKERNLRIKINKQ